MSIMKKRKTSNKKNPHETQNHKCCKRIYIKAYDPCDWNKNEKLNS